MMRTCFPAGNPIPVPQSHQRWNKDVEDPKKALLVRIFSLFPLDDDFEVQDSNLDFSLTVFMSYAQQLKLQLRFIFQSILYKLFKQGKCPQV
jgi:hypothetical protein